ncbi:RNA polymerase sigma factor [Propionibacteriaceae bacterium Y1685]|uniref:RNA polymerase sigma factor n=1 Tax=Microlunatus sp. Y1700 TaxID=3418487 RepID=UPI003B7EFD9C
MTAADLEHVWRRETPHVLGVLVRRHGHFADCEDAVAEALVAAAEQWPVEGVPTNPRGWLVRVAERRFVDGVRADRARIDREDRLAADPTAASQLRSDQGGANDDNVELLLLCCHPVLSPASRVALTLRAVGGLTTEQIAAAFLVPARTMGTRISRAKATLRDQGARFAAVPAEEREQRIASVLQVLYLIFNEGYTSSGGPELITVSLIEEAIRLTRDLRQRLDDHAEVSGLLALMLLTASRTAARTTSTGDLVPLAEQDRRLWDRTMINEGVALITASLAQGPVGPYQLQAAIAAVHCEAPTAEDTDWLEITMLYRMLEQLTPGPTVTLNLAVAVGMAHGPDAGLAMVDPLVSDPVMARQHRTHAVRAHLLEQAGRDDDAREAFALAARLTTSVPEQRYLNARARITP